MGKLSIGTDPEFVLKKKNSSTYVSAPNVINHFKNSPLKTKHGSIFCDNANIELTVNPANNAGQFVDHIQGILKDAHELVGKDYEIVAVSSLYYPVEELEHPYCKEFGCEPDYDAYQLKENVIPEDAAVKTFRSCGGHVHVGNEGDYDFLFDPYGKIDTVKAMDAFLGIPSLFLDDSAESHNRRALYGTAGAHRPKSYGVEYRTLSNYWLKHPELAAFVYEMTYYAVESIKDGKIKNIVDGVDIRRCINRGNKNVAYNVIDNICCDAPEAYTEYERATKVMRRVNREKMSLKEAWDL